ncbi:membrane-bound lytic murein transglycosylase [Candidatus Vecturithrix granuli]|uniref:Membrane-bound lytic murein transglycosylase n=1 Tax=Vecturithrix granuli TaxID=1499967 RepID=A0A081BYW3_VECG1|nr:membrane-bound lytic murein transglycosylase [Candidatus Vecturithrix granuli]
MKNRNTLPYVRTGLFLVLLVFVGNIPEGMALSETDFQTIGSRYGVSPYLLLAISVMESQAGELTGIYEVQKVVDSTQLKFLQKIARHTRRGISEFKGSRSGAMGYMQIVPSTFYTYAQDGDGDGIKDPLNSYDSLATAAYFLARTIAVKSNLRTALRSYNNSSVYCNKVLKLSSELELESKLAARR